MKITESDIFELSNLCKKLGWTICIPGGDSDVDVPGLIIGTGEFVDDITNSLGGDFEVYTFPYMKHN